MLQVTFTHLNLILSKLSLWFKSITAHAKTWTHDGIYSTEVIITNCNLSKNNLFKSLIHGIPDSWNPWFMTFHSNLWSLQFYFFLLPQILKLYSLQINCLFWRKVNFCSCCRWTLSPQTSMVFLDVALIWWGRAKFKAAFNHSNQIYTALTCQTTVGNSMLQLVSLVIQNVNCLQWNKHITDVK